MALVAFIALLAAPASAKDPYQPGDHYLECLLGKGGVAMRHGATVDQAIEVAKKACTKTMEPDGSAAAEDGDYVDYVIGLASDTLQSAVDRGGIF